MLKEFVQNFQSAVLSTIDEEQFPFSSYAPLLQKDGKFYIFISNIAQHAKNLQRTQKVSVFFIEDEQSCKNIFARKRAVYQCSSQCIDKNTPSYETILGHFEQNHGKTVSVLKGMQDFNLYELTPLKGQAVFGFGEAYDIHAQDIYALVQRQGTQGHK